MAGLENTEITAGTGSHFFRNHSEKLLDSLFVLQIAENKTAILRVILLRACDQRLCIDAQRLGLCQSGEDSLMLDKRDRQVGQKGLAVSLLTAEVIEFFIMSHCAI